MTIYDGTGADLFYLRWLFFFPVMDQDSPALKGAENKKIEGLTHDALRTDKDAMSLYLNFVQRHNNLKISGIPFTHPLDRKRQKGRGHLSAKTVEPS